MIQVNNKFNIGDKVYFIDSNKKAACSVVKDEEQAFATESDLKKYVFRDLIEFV